MREGLPLPTVDAARVGELAAQGLVEADYERSGRVVLTLRGRLLADAVTRALT
jgi:oxygen-independent coproporphyrinogen-3 oxidase